MMSVDEILAKQVTIQSVVDNLQISCLEYRNEDDPDVKQFVHNRKLELLQVHYHWTCMSKPKSITRGRKLLCRINTEHD